MRSRAALLVPILILFMWIIAGCSSTDEMSPTQPDTAIAPEANFLTPETLQAAREKPGDVMPLMAPILPSWTLVAQTALDAIRVCDEETYWDTWTQFVEWAKYKDFKVGWLEDIPDNPDPNAYYFYLFMDVPVRQPGQYTIVEPQTEWISDAADRIITALEDPYSIINWSYDDDEWVYRYQFDYPVGNTYHHVEISKVHMYWME